MTRFSTPIHRVIIRWTIAAMLALALLGAMLPGQLVVAPATSPKEKAGQEKASPVKKVWEFKPEPNVMGMYACSPLIAGEAIYAAYSGNTGYATLVRLDRQAGLKKWEFFGKNDDFRQTISTPCIADGKLYFGEGFHNDKSCRVFCVDAEKGTEVWTFKTDGQTESSPAVANGKVYIGAGNDGVYCLDAKKGEKLWKFPPANYKGRLLRFGGGMNVVGKRLYCGTGVDRNEPNDKGETAALCIDADNGKLLWKAAVPYPVWSMPVVKDGFVYVTTGNGDVLEDDKEPGGALVCFDADTGKEKWRCKVGNGIIETPAVDGHRVYFGCRDGNIYCIGRADGKERWRHFLGSPIIGTPVLDVDAAGERRFGVFTAAVAGKICCLTPQNGDIVWTYDLTKQQTYIATSPRLVVTRTKDGFRRQLFVGGGIGGGIRDLTANRPAFFCIEDVY